MIGDISKCAGPIWDMLEPGDEKTDHHFNFWKHLGSVAKSRRTRTATHSTHSEREVLDKGCQFLHGRALDASSYLKGVDTLLHIHSFRNQGLFEEEDDPK